MHTTSNSYLFVEVNVLPYGQICVSIRVMRKQHSKHLHAWRGQKSAVTESMTVETTVCLRDQTIGRCRFWFKELTDPNPPLPARWFEGRVKKQWNRNPAYGLQPVRIQCPAIWTNMRFNKGDAKVFQTPSCMARPEKCGHWKRSFWQRRQTTMLL